MGEKILQTEIEREPNMLYYCAGNPVAIYKAQMGRKKKEEPKKVEKPELPELPEQAEIAETKDVVIEKQQPTKPTLVEPAVMKEGVAQTAEMMAQAREAKIKQLENQMKEIAKTIEELKPRPDNEFKAVDSRKELEELEGKPKKKRFGLFRRK